MTSAVRVLDKTSCQSPGCSAWAQRKWAEPDGARRCMGHSRAPEARTTREKAGLSGRPPPREDGAPAGPPVHLVPAKVYDDPAEEIADKTKLVGAPKPLEIEHEKDWRELSRTEEGLEYLRAWWMQQLALRKADPAAVAAARSLIADMKEAMKREKADEERSKWEGHPLVEAFRAAQVRVEVALAPGQQGNDPLRAWLGSPDPQEP